MIAGCTATDVPMCRRTAGGGSRTGYTTLSVRSVDRYQMVPAEPSTDGA